MPESNVQRYLNAKNILFETELGVQASFTSRHIYVSSADSEIPDHLNSDNKLSNREAQ